MKTFKEYIKEDGAVMSAGPTNTAGGGQVAGIGVGPKGEPGVHPKKKNKVVMNPMRRRSPPQM
jgi:hypothetical protein